MSIISTFYNRPTGRATEIEIIDIRPEDEQWFKDNNIKISAEEDSLRGGWIFYADYGLPENEAIEFSLGKTCKATMQALRETTQHMLEKSKNA